MLAGVKCELDIGICLKFEVELDVGICLKFEVINLLYPSLGSVCSIYLLRSYL